MDRRALARQEVQQMPVFEIDALGGTVDYTVEAENESHAEQLALERLKEDFRHTVGINALKTYEVRFLADGTRANVLAANTREAHQNAHEWIKNKVERALNGSRLNQDAEDLLREISTDVEVEGVSESGHYEIDRDANWDEGDIEEVTC